MFIIIRMIIGFVFLGCSITVIKKSKTIRKRMLYVLFTSLSVALVAVLAILPFENFFVTFDTLKESYTYYDFGKSNIELVVEGDGCDFVVGSKNGSETYLIIPKTADGWKIGVGINTKRIVKEISNGIVVYVYQYKNTDDYFITILDTNGGESVVLDDYNTAFCSLERNETYLGKTFVTYYAHIPSFASTYSVTVNDNKIVLENQ